MGKLRTISVEEASKIMGVHADTLRKGLQQGLFPWGYAIKTSPNRYVYIINAVRFAEIERVTA